MQDLRPNVSTASSSTRRRTSASCGGRRCSRAYAIPRRAVSSSFSTRRNASLPDKASCRSPWRHSRSMRTSATPRTWPRRSRACRASSCGSAAWPARRCASPNARPDDALYAADDQIEQLLEDWEPGQIALLTTGRRHGEQINEIELGGHQRYWDDFFQERDVFYGHVLGFKGLERPVVVLAVNGFRDLERAKEMLYVGLSRARTQLVVCGDIDLIGRVGGEGVKRRLQRGAQA